MSTGLFLIRKKKLTMSRQVGHASDCIALHLYVGAQHLPDQRLQSSKRDNEQLVFGYVSACPLRTLTIDGQIAKRSTGGTLNFAVMAG